MANVSTPKASLVENVPVCALLGRRNQVLRVLFICHGRPEDRKGRGSEWATFEICFQNYCMNYCNKNNA